MTVSQGAGDDGWRDGRGVRDTGYRRAVARSDAFALSWYGARSAGESLRARATAWLYQHPARGRPGGAHPDPRLSSAFSWWSILRAGAQDIGLELVEVSDAGQLAAVDRALGNGVGLRHQADQVRWCWLLTYPDGAMPSVMHRVVGWRDRTVYSNLCWQVAMLLGDVCRNYAELTDPIYPAGYHVPSTARSHVACLHQFASALLRTEPECPAEWGCDCNRIRASLSVAPEEHLQATDALLLSDLRAEVARQQAEQAMMAAQAHQAYQAKQAHGKGPRVARGSGGVSRDGASEVAGGPWELPSSGTWVIERRPGDEPTG
ncbi:MAG TPA: hypothetical protein VGR57_21590 [Ktedonobacterales bacterium]|nr:hypothetical protein [Ktedonobacterales bacterium]